MGITAAGVGGGLKATVVPTTTLTDVKEQANELYLAIVNEATKLQESAEIEAMDVIITIDSIKFNKLALSGMIGDRTSQTFAGGKFSVGEIGGYRIQSGEIFLPKTVKTTAKITGAGVTSATASAAGDQYAELAAYFRRDDEFFH